MDVKNILFLELGVLSTNCLQRTLFFNNWISFLQILINNKAYEKLFEFFGFKESMLVYNDRVIHEPQFFKCLKNLIFNSSNFSNNSNDENKNAEDDSWVDFLIYTCDLFKNTKGLISLSILKRKIASNLKNLKDLKMTSTFNNNNMAMTLKSKKY